MTSVREEAKKLRQKKKAMFIYILTWFWRKNKWYTCHSCYDDFAKLDVR